MAVAFNENACYVATTVTGEVMAALIGFDAIVLSSSTDFGFEPTNVFNIFNKFG